ncbi:hypothetical protein ABEB36_005912 [Hypothenemus hampei]|uniref:Uncharacterized protein n=1 Tax=Hypothenemus hampei TaxID=57062 RepID=A0ABD1F0J2_HYPHA
MEEIYIKSADLDVEDVARESATQTVTLSSPKDSLYKIYRQGDKIHQIRDENVTMVQGGTATQRTSVEPEEQMDEISSGESLFKTFTFNNGITKEETEKCLSFWRSVVEKNLEPIKCSIIENIEKLKGDCDERKKEKCQKKRNIKKPSKLETHSDCATPQKNVWCDIMNELQKKRINETKLLMEKRCRFCGYVNSPPYETEDLEKQTLSMINELSTWQPKSHKRKGTEALINNIITNEPIKEKKDFLQLSKKQMRKSSLAILNCVCSNEKCDCFRKLTFPERATLPLSKIELSPDTANFAVQKLNSVDIREKNLRVSSNIEESLEIKSRKSLISNRGESRKLSRKSVDSLTLLKKRSSKNYQNKNKDADEDELKYEPQ